MELLIDPGTGSPKWNTANGGHYLKESFASEAAKRLKAKTLTVTELKDQIIAAANMEWRRMGNREPLRSLDDVMDKIGSSGKYWFFEIRRVARHPALLQILIDREGRGLTALSRRAGPIQAQRRKGHANPDGRFVILELTETLNQIRRRITHQEIPANPFIEKCAKDLKVFQALLKKYEH